METEIYKVVRYFDDVYEATVATDKTHEEANVLAKKLNSAPRAYVSYEVRRQND